MPLRHLYLWTNFCNHDKKLWHGCPVVLTFNLISYSGHQTDFRVQMAAITVTLKCCTIKIRKSFERLGHSFFCFLDYITRWSEKLSSEMHMRTVHQGHIFLLRKLTQLPNSLQLYTKLNMSFSMNSLSKKSLRNVVFFLRAKLKNNLVDVRKPTNYKYGLSNTDDIQVPRTYKHGAPICLMYEVNTKYASDIETLLPVYSSSKS